MQARSTGCLCVERCVCAVALLMARARGCAQLRWSPPDDHGAAAGNRGQVTNGRLIEGGDAQVETADAHPPTMYTSARNALELLSRGCHQDSARGGGAWNADPSSDSAVCCSICPSRLRRNARLISPHYACMRPSGPVLLVRPGGRTRPPAQQFVDPASRVRTAGVQ